MFKFKTYENHLHGLGVPARCPVPGETWFPQCTAGWRRSKCLTVWEICNLRGSTLSQSTLEEDDQMVSPLVWLTGRTVQWSFFNLFPMAGLWLLACGCMGGRGGGGGSPGEGPLLVSTASTASFADISYTLKIWEKSKSPILPHLTFARAFLLSHSVCPSDLALSLLLSLGLTAPKNCFLVSSNSFILESSYSSLENISFMLSKIVIMEGICGESSESRVKFYQIVCREGLLVKIF